MLSNKKNGEAYKKFLRGVQGGSFFKKRPPEFKIKKCILFFIVLSFFIHGLILASGQYRVLSWSGDVKIRKGGKFISLTGRAKISLKKGDGIWLAKGAEVKLLFPGGVQKVFYGPRFTRVETLEKARKGASTLVNLIKSIGIEELLSRKKEDAAAATRSFSLRLYKKIKKAIPEMEEPLLAVGKEKEMNEVLALVAARFDAAPMEKQVLIKARVYKHFNRDKHALKTVLDYYEKIRNLEDRKRERNFIEDFLLDEFLPVVITFNLEDPDFIIFSSNFKLWWAAFFYDGEELKEIVKTIETSLNPQDTFWIKHVKVSSKKDKPYYLFIIASYHSSGLAKFVDLEEAKKELLGKDIPVASTGKAVGIGKVILKIGLKKKK